MIPLQTGAQGAGDGHRPDAKEESSGDKALAQGVPAILSAAFEASVHAVAKALDRPVNVQGNPGNAAQHDGEDDSHAVHFGIQPQYAADYHAQAKCLHQSIRIFLGKAAPQQQAQEFIPEPDTVDQDAARRDAIAQEKAEREQEERRRQEQVDLTEEREKQKAAENQRRLAAQAEEAERQKKLAEIRRQREQAARQAELAEQKLRQLQQVQQRQTAAATPSQGTPGQGGTSEDLTARYAAAIQQAVTAQWIRPDTVPLGQRCRVSIRQLPGGEVIDVQVQAGCPFDDAGRRSLEAAVLRAQPLPYRGFENVFQRNLTLNFEAQDR